MSKKNDGTKIVQHEIHDEMKNSYIDYAMSVIVGRALPDVRDGLKPVHRRILYGMSELGVTPDKPHKKSARIVGEVMGKYHPHGDSSIYDAMVRLAQDFSTRYMLVDGHGNFGSVDGDGAAAMRYTEARMTPFALEMLKDIEKETVDFMPNFDEEEQEPVVLPSRFPNLLVNGSNGIAVGMATSIPPHNLGEVIKATVKLIEDEETSVDELAKIVKGPDFPTGATIMGKGKIRDAYRTGQGKILVRSKAEIEKASRGREQIVITEIPYQVNKAKLIEKIADLVKDKKIEGITDIRDESNREGMRVVIELKRDVNPQIVLNRLYKQTSLQESFSIIMLALVDGQPKICNLKDILVEYLKHQKDVVTRRTRYDLAKAEARAHILEGLRIALDNIDEIIRIIRESYDDAKKKLMKAFKLSDIQAQAILDMRLARLQGLEREKIEAEYQELMKKIAYYKQLLADERMLMDVIKDELLEIRKSYGDKRRTAIVAEAEEIEEKDLIVEQEVEITLSYKGFVRCVPAGTSPPPAREDDFVKSRALGSTHDQLLFFTNTGKAHVLKIFEVPKTHRMGKGTPLTGLLSVMQRERITAMHAVRSFEEERYIMAVTKQGNIKKVDLRQFNTSRKGGIVAISLKEGDELIGVKELNGKGIVIVVTKQGKCISFSEADVNPTGRTAAGVRAIQLAKGDEIVAMELASPKEELCVVTAHGYGKRTAVKEFRMQVRGGKGLFVYEKARLKTDGVIVGMVTVTEQNQVALVSSEGTVSHIEVSEIVKLSRVAPGSRILELEKDVAIVAVGKSTFKKNGGGAPDGPGGGPESLEEPDEPEEMEGLEEVDPGRQLTLF